MRIPLANSQLYVEVDDEDYEQLSKYRWYNNNGYAHRIEEGRSILMHRQILNILDNVDLVGDHIDHDRLNNTKSNLRACTTRENNLNRIRRPCNIRKELRNGGVREVFIFRGLTYASLEAATIAKEMYEEAKA